MIDLGGRFFLPLSFPFPPSFMKERIELTLSRLFVVLAFPQAMRMQGCLVTVKVEA